MNVQFQVNSNKKPLGVEFSNKPSLTVFLPFEPKMSSGNEIFQTLKKAGERVTRLMTEKYPGVEGDLIVEKFQNLIEHLDFHTYKKSIALFISPLMEKVLYVDMALEPKVVVDECFEIRDLVYSKKQVHKYLVLVLGIHENRVYLGNTTSFVKILSKTASLGFEPIVKETIADLSLFRPELRKRTAHFLETVDQSLDIILGAFRLPLYVLGDERILSGFSHNSRHANAVVEYIHGNYEYAQSCQLREVLEPYIEDWQRVVEKDLSHQLLQAEPKNQLLHGIGQVWAESHKNTVRLLLVEKNYMYGIENFLGADINESDKKSSIVGNSTDAVDYVIEKVLSNGGDVEFVEEGFLEDYGKIVGIKKEKAVH